MNTTVRDRVEKRIYENTSKYICEFTYWHIETIVEITSAKSSIHKKSRNLRQKLSSDSWRHNIGNLIGKDTVISSRKRREVKN